MRRAALLGSIGLLPLMMVGCHAHTTAAASGKEKQAQTMEKPPETPQVGSARPVRTTPGGMLDSKSIKQLQGALRRKGFAVAETGQLDESTEAAIRKFQARERIAATGLPDFDTVRRLGLDPKAMYLGGTQRRNEAKR
ncbi:MAG: Peptidoglycan-binding domain 1 protein [bacterium]|nr:Peptidoglycan-binding domain 1 protein [bacterium]